MYLLFDVGGTNIRFGVSRQGTSVDTTETHPTPYTFSEGIALFRRVAGKLSQGEKIDAIAGGLASSMDRTHENLLSPPNLPGWANAPVKKALEEALGAPAFLENDAALAGLGEVVFGAGKGKDIVVYMTVSTGVGGARIVRGNIDANVLGFEPGHQIIDATGTLDPAGNLESYISGTAVEKRFGKKPHEIEDLAAWDEIARWLAVGLNNVTVFWSPDVIVLGGSMVLKKPGIDVERVRAHFKEVLTIFPKLPEVVQAALGDFGGLHGALAFAQENAEKK